MGNARKVTDPSRRDVVRLGGASVGAGALALTLAACGGDDTSGGGAAAGSDSGSDSGSVVIALSDVPVGGAVVTSDTGTPLVVAQPEAGQVKAFSAKCTHQGCIVAVNGTELDCPCHQSVFDAFTGEVQQGPATEALPAVDVVVQGENVVTA